VGGVEGFDIKDKGLESKNNLREVDEDEELTFSVSDRNEEYS
jgi:hypothetical protein